MKVQTFKCYGGPLDGLEVTEQYAGEDYVRYNACAGRYPKYMEVTLKDGSKFDRCIKGQYINPSCVLVYFPG